MTAESTDATSRVAEPGAARDGSSAEATDDALNARLASIIESSDDAIASKDLAGIITSWNVGAERLFGYSKKEVLGKPMAILIPPERAAEESEILARIARGESTDHFETVRVRKDGQFIHVSVTISPIRDSRGAIVGASKIARDITERKRAEEANARLAAIVESSDDAIVGKTLEGVITDWNPAAERLYGWSAAEAVGRPNAPRVGKSGSDARQGLGAGHDQAMLEELRRRAGQ